MATYHEKLLLKLEELAQDMTEDELDEVLAFIEALPNPRTAEPV